MWVRSLIWLMPIRLKLQPGSSSAVRRSDAAAPAFVAEVTHLLAVRSRSCRGHAWLPSRRTCGRVWPWS
jgi:hypothetical protein